MSEWKPISTAPKDGTKVIVWFAETQEMFACPFENGLWQTGVWRAKRIEPTHWMPLPEPPVMEQ